MAMSHHDLLQGLDRMLTSMNSYETKRHTPMSSSRFDVIKVDVTMGHSSKFMSHYDIH